MNFHLSEDFPSTEKAKKIPAEESLCRDMPEGYSRQPFSLISNS